MYFAPANVVSLTKHKTEQVSDSVFDNQGVAQILMLTLLVTFFFHHDLMCHDFYILFILFIILLL